jgi:hypothetical protein
MSLPPFFDTNDSSHIIVAHIYAERQRRSMAAIIGSGSFQGSGGLQANAVVLPPPPATISLSTAQVEIEIGAAPTETTESLQPPKLAEFLVTVFCAKSSKAADALRGDMLERFHRDCEKRGPPRARLLYWGEAMRSLWPLFRRWMGRAATFAAIMSSIKGCFGG